MHTAHVPPLALALSGLVLALNPGTPSTALAFIGAAALFGFTKWLEVQSDKRPAEVDAQLKDLKAKVDSLLMARGLGR